MRFRRLQIRMQTTDGPYGVALDFPDGLVVVWADNSMGKSTCVKAILVALGMEAMLTTSQIDLPVPPAIKTRLATDSREYNVLESEVFLEIENARHERIVVQRTIKGSRDKNLITVHEGPALSAPSGAVPTRDFFVGRQGAATRESGFHHFLATFLDWPLPTVQTYDGNEYVLYLQCILPYFVVEQTRGWSTVQPPLPTQFRIQDAHKRVVEFLLNMDAHRVALKRQELQFEKSRIESSWAAQIARIVDLGERVGGSVQALPQKPVAAWPPQLPVVLAVPVGDAWITIGERVEKNLKELSELVEKEIPRVTEISESAQTELTLMDQKVRDQQTLLARLMDTLEMEEQEVSRVDERLTAIDEDIQRNKDVRILKQLGSRTDSTIDNGACPVCHQSIHDSLLPLATEQVVMSLDENIQFLTEQRLTFAVVQANSRKVVNSRQQQVRAVREELSHSRDRTRILRQTLVSDGRLPSAAAIHARIELEQSTKRDQEGREQFEQLIAALGELAQRWRVLQESLASLPKDDVTERTGARSVHGLCRFGVNLHSTGLAVSMSTKP